MSYETESFETYETDNVDSNPSRLNYDLSFGDLMDYELKNETLDTNSDTYDDDESDYARETDTLKYEEDLTEKAFLAVTLNRNFKKQNMAITPAFKHELTQSIEALIALVNEFGKPDALDDLLLLLSELDSRLKNILHLVSSSLEALASTDTLPLKNDSMLGESNEKITLELQQHLIQGLGSSLIENRDRTKPILEVLKNENAYFSRDPQVLEMLSDL